jgi:hypothetical protein
MGPLQRVSAAHPLRRACVPKVVKWCEYKIQAAAAAAAAVMMMGCANHEIVGVPTECELQAGHCPV